MITSTSNPKIKQVALLRDKARARREEGAYVVEGLRMFREIPASDVREVYVTQDFYNKNGSLCSTYKDLQVVSDKVFEKIADTVTPQGVVAVVSMKETSLEDVLKGDFLLFLENIQDPGNLGTLFRTAEGAGVKGIIISKGSADIYNPKVIRSTMGSIFRMPYIYVEDIASVISKEASNMNIYAAALEGAKDYTTVSYTGRCGILIGNEGNGLKNETIKAAGKSVYIPMQGSVESLNASISGAILMYEAARQRK